MSEECKEKDNDNNSSDNDTDDRNPSVKRSVDSSDSPGDEVPTEPKKKISFGLSSTKKTLIPAMKQSSKVLMKPHQKAAGAPPVHKLKPKTGATALAFSHADDEEEEEEEEMPPEAKMRMKNIGRETPTSSGPNSFGKSRMGFCDSKKIYERKLKELQEHDDE